MWDFKSPDARALQQGLDTCRSGSHSQYCISAGACIGVDYPLGSLGQLRWLRAQL